MKHRKMTIMLAALIALLTACSTQYTSPEQEKDPAVEPVPEQPVDNTEPSQDNNNSSDPDTPVSAPAEENQTIRLPETVLTYEMEGMKEEKMGYLGESKNQEYSFYVMEGYQFAEEEPGRDIVMLEANRDIYMRIEVLPDDVNFVELKENTKATLEAGFTEVFEITTGIPKHELFEDVVYMFAAHNNKMKAEAYVIKGNKTRPHLRITCVGVEEVESFSPFWAMANTILRQ
ncbi:hypothetical protein [Bacillus alveayuensis]|jgi:hypothetical protein|uniref:hypothetical protein n=1 Tax=Aeribacillus alveayuensis TaxID=279215 RepID=UPI0005D1240E|nr:hypothetical protein [Bacillus alveayuensis]